MKNKIRYFYRYCYETDLYSYLTLHANLCNEKSREKNQLTNPSYGIDNSIKY